ncbi:S8 family peptidase [Streptomyces sp. NBC_01210]|uniref:S8 family peptidase n=1 Tax=Streptomyces sp. NBC_01210 TaxID=2903774 RepID=UPI002E15E010|nr:S8 family peptidase [Streptomyces sp. NBC_01210]
MRKRTRLTAFAAAALTAALVAAGLMSASSQSAQASDEHAAPATLYRSANAVPGRYIVTLGKGVDSESMTGLAGVEPLFTYTSAMRGFAAALSPLQLDQVRSTPGVVAVEEDAAVSVLGSTGSHTRAAALSAAALSAPASWGLDRIDQHNLPLDNSFTPKSSGRGATAYILDTGIDFDHTEFGGRAKLGYDSVGDGWEGRDCHGHGTHVAGTVAGKTYGVARAASLVSIRVLDCLGSGTWSSVIAGLDWVAAHAKHPAVLNASIGGEKSVAVNKAVTAVSDSGVLPIVAAGNESADACDVSPASADRVVAVGASDRDDDETDFSNFGECLSLYAPGVDIVSANFFGGSVALTGTSMASPHVAGVAALYAAKHPKALPKQLAAWLEDGSTKDVLGNAGEGSPNRLLYTNGL